MVRRKRTVKSFLVEYAVDILISISIQWLRGMRSDFILAFSAEFPLHYRITGAVAMDLWFLKWDVNFIWNVWEKHHSCRVKVFKSDVITNSSTFGLDFRKYQVDRYLLLSKCANVVTRIVVYFFPSAVLISILLVRCYLHDAGLFYFFVSTSFLFCNFSCVNVNCNNFNRT